MATLTTQRYRQQRSPTPKVNIFQTVDNDWYQLLMFAVKRLMENHNWDTVALYDKDHYYRGFAVFEDEKSAKQYLEFYNGIINKRRRKERQVLKVFDESAKAKRGRPPKAQPKTKKQ